MTKLWAHQDQAVTAVAWQIGRGGRATVVAACGTGKTRIGATAATLVDYYGGTLTRS